VITVYAELQSAISAARDDTLCRVEIVNDGTGTTQRGNYDVRLYARGRNGRLIRRARIENYARNAQPAWRLIAAAFEAIENA
jgi:hypothetical protein